MFSRHLAIATITLASTAASVSAAEKGIPEDVLAKMAADLARIQAVTEEIKSMRRADLLDAPALRVTGEKAAIRRNASSTADTIAIIPAGQDLPIIGSAPNWYAVATDNNVIGWVSADDVMPTASSKKSKAIVSNLDNLPIQWSSPGQIIDLERAAVTMQAKVSASWAEQGISELLKMASAFKDAYADNPYVKVRVFNISLSMSPSIGMDFEFK